MSRHLPLSFRLEHGSPQESIVHYKDAATATHRAYSKANKKPGQPYGGGPGNEHNWSTGLLHYYYLTGDPLAHDAVLSLANWVINRDDGRQTFLGLIDDGPTGLASRTGGDERYLLTVAGRGYRFVTPVERESAAQPERTAEAAPGKAARLHARPSRSRP